MATFSGVTLNKVGTGYTITATSGSLASTTTSSINVVPGGAATIRQQPAAIECHGRQRFRFSVAAEDTEGNLATSFSGMVNVSLANNPGSSTLGAHTGHGATRRRRGFLRTVAQLRRHGLIARGRQRSALLGRRPATSMLLPARRRNWSSAASRRRASRPAARSAFRSR